MITDLQRQQLATLERARVMCEADGIVARVAGHGVLVLCLPIYGDAEAEQLLLEATEPGAGQGRHEGRRSGDGQSQGA